MRRPEGLLGAAGTGLGQAQPGLRGPVATSAHLPAKSVSPCVCSYYVYQHQAGAIYRPEWSSIQLMQAANIYWVPTVCQALC